MEYVEGLRGASKTKAAQLPWRSLLNRLTVCDAVSELAAITGLTSKNTSGSLRSSASGGWIELQREASEAYRGRG